MVGQKVHFEAHFACRVEVMTQKEGHYWSEVERIFRILKLGLKEDEALVGITTSSRGRQNYTH